MLVEGTGSASAGFPEDWLICCWRCRVTGGEKRNSPFGGVELESLRASSVGLESLNPSASSAVSALRLALRCRWLVEVVGCGSCSISASGISAIVSNATFPETLRLRRVATSNFFGGTLWSGSVNKFRRPFRVGGTVGLVSVSLFVGDVSTSAIVSRGGRRAPDGLVGPSTCPFSASCLSGVRRKPRRVGVRSSPSATSADEERFGVLGTLPLVLLEGVSVLLGPGTGDDPRPMSAEEEE